MGNTESEAPKGFAFLVYGFLGIGLCLGLYGLHLWFMTLMTPPVAFISSGGIALLLPVFYLIYAQIQRYLHMYRMKKFYNEIKDMSESALDMADDALGGLLKSNPKLSAAIVAIIGLLIAKRVL